MMPTNRGTCALACCLLAGPVLGAVGHGPSANELFADAIDAGRQRVVKLYGATIGREKAYGCGVLVSADGKIVTVLSVLLEGRHVRAVLWDGRELPVRILARDERRQLALLKIEAGHLPFFELTSSGDLTPGDWVIAATNAFKVAEGSEPVSVSVGLLAGRAHLSARFRARDFPYDGPVLLTDLIVTTPGCAGGALIDARGRLVGVIGKPVVGKLTNTWVNCALPVEEVAALVTAGDVRLGDAPPEPTTRAVAEKPADLGLLLFDVGGHVRPAYVERVRPDSPAWKAGLRPNDLLVSLDGQPITTCEDFERLATRLRAGQRVALVVKRGEQLQMLELTVEPPPE